MPALRYRLLYYRFKRLLLSRLYVTRLLFGLGLLVILVVFSPVLFGFGRDVFRLTGSQLPSTSGRTNFLLMGIGGVNHDGPDLTDSLIFVSFKTDTGQATLLSLPRDIWVPSLKAKINTAYHYGQQRQPDGGGLVLAKSSVSEIINQPVHLGVVIDFATFQQAVDLLGGLDVRVDNSFTDSHYPIPGQENALCPGDPLYSCRYETVTFTSGLHHFDGATALKFVRSRYAVGSEGSDFARNRRQAKVLASIKAKLLSWSVLTHPRLYLDLYHLLTKNVITDLQPDQYFALAKLALSASRQPLKIYSLSEPDQLYNPPLSQEFDNQWILLFK
ncbi:MAG: LCP family protein, partial [Firmicutes bacterium]|nr:LCP family protein [Bacillota bacterium]